MYPAKQTLYLAFAHGSALLGTLPANFAPLPFFPLCATIVVASASRAKSPEDRARELEFPYSLSRQRPLIVRERASLPECRGNQLSSQFSGRALQGVSGILIDERHDAREHATLCQLTLIKCARVVAPGNLYSSIGRFSLSLSLFLLAQARARGPNLRVQQARPRFRLRATPPGGLRRVTVEIRPLRWQARDFSWKPV